MCSQYTAKIRNLDKDDATIDVGEFDTNYIKRIFPKDSAPVVVLDENKNLKLEIMVFSLIPSWSLEPKVKFATHNARIETVLEKPTWKAPFKSNHCVVPMAGFYESVYEGDSAGNVIQFIPENDNIIYAAGIFDVWVDPITKTKMKSFSILTTEPPPFILKNGHDRTPIFLERDDSEYWLESTDNAKDSLNFLLDSLIHPKLKIAIDRPLKAGWEKRK